jgi:hypothetical protein
MSSFGTHFKHSLSLACAKIQDRNDPSRLIADRIGLIFEHKLNSPDPTLFQNGITELTKVFASIESADIALRALDCLEGAHAQDPSLFYKKDSVPFKELLVDICLAPNYPGALFLAVSIGNATRLCEGKNRFDKNALHDLSIQISAESIFISRMPLQESEVLRNLIKAAMAGTIQKIPRDEFGSVIDPEK